MCRSPSVIANAPPKDCPGVLTEYIQQEPGTDTDDPCKNMAKLIQITNHLAHATLPLQFRTRLLNSKPASTYARNTTTINEQSNYPTNMLASEDKRLPLQPQLPSQVWMVSQACVNKNIAQSHSKQTATEVAQS